MTGRELRGCGRDVVTKSRSLKPIQFADFMHHFIPLLPFNRIELGRFRESINK